MKALTFKEFIELANKYYEKGGDSYVECWDETTFNQYTEWFGEITQKRARRMFKSNYEEEKEHMAIREQIRNGEW